MYSVTVMIYGCNKIELTTTVDSWKTALQIAKDYSSSVLAKNWTRHNSCPKVIQHLDYYCDSFNEGSIVIEKV